jgi:hypothetical protein
VLLQFLRRAVRAAGVARGEGLRDRVAVRGQALCDWCRKLRRRSSPLVAAAPATAKTQGRGEGRAELKTDSALPLLQPRANPA